MADAVARECRAVRTGVGLTDASTLGKIDVQGADAAEFLERLYCNKIGTIKVGRARYSALCRLDGTLFDDGVVMRLAANHFFVTTSSGHAASVLEWMEEWHQTEWPDLNVWLTSITEQWTTLVVAGPAARKVLEPVSPWTDLSGANLPFMGVGPAVIAGLDAQIARVSFSGELAFEVSVPGYRGLELWDALMTAGSIYQIAPYGLEALATLRAEKGYLIVGQDTDSTTTPFDAGLGWMVAKDKDFIGRRSLARPAMIKPDRKQLVGILPDDPTEWIPEGAQLVADPKQPPPMTMLGYLTSSYRSETLGTTFALAALASGTDRIGTRLYATLGDRMIPVRVVDPVFYDKEGARKDG